MKIISQNGKISPKKAILGAGGALVALLITSLGGLLSLHNKNKAAQENIRELASVLEMTEQNLLMASSTNAALSIDLEEREKEISTLRKSVRKITKTADELEKLAKTDKELLEKYSKVYFLNEHYTPTKLSNIPEEFLLVKDKEVKIHKDVLEFLENLLEDAKEDGVDLRILSGYRSFETQAALKSNYKVVYGAGTANQFSADQGYSEHQLGTTVDFTTPFTGANLTTAFEGTEAYKWLDDKAYRYGFILSYPKGNAYYQYEPWHWRFVGKDLARKLHREEKNFYDLDQRVINEYLLEIFD